MTYKFCSTLWKYPGENAWVFCSLSKELSNQIRQIFKKNELAWGRMKVVAKYDKLEWKTSIWYDTKKEVYLLPIKKEIRTKAALKLGATYDFSIII